MHSLPPRRDVGRINERKQHYLLPQPPSSASCAQLLSQFSWHTENRTTCRAERRLYKRSDQLQKAGKVHVWRRCDDISIDLCVKPGASRWSCWSSVYDEAGKSLTPPKKVYTYIYCVFYAQSSDDLLSSGIRHWVWGAFNLIFTRMTHRWIFRYIPCVHFRGPNRWSEQQTHMCRWKLVCAPNTTQIQLMSAEIAGLWLNTTTSI